MGQVKYIPQNQRDELWGLTVCSVGYQSVGPGEEYPPQGHNQEYMFSPATGRTLPEYQLLYIVDHLINLASLPYVEVLYNYPYGTFADLRIKRIPPHARIHVFY